MFVVDHGVAVQDRAADRKLFHLGGDVWKPVRPVVAAARDNGRQAVVNTDHEAIAVPLDFERPLRAARRDWNELGEAGSTRPDIGSADSSPQVEAGVIQICESQCLRCLLTSPLIREEIKFVATAHDTNLLREKYLRRDFSDEILAIIDRDERLDFEDLFGDAEGRAERQLPAKIAEGSEFGRPATTVHTLTRKTSNAAERRPKSRRNVRK